VLSSPPKYQNKVPILFEIIGKAITSKEYPSAERLQVTEKVFAIIVEAIENPISPQKIKVLQNWVILFLLKFEKFSEEINNAIYLLQEFLVAKFIKGYTIQYVWTDKVWDVKITAPFQKERDVYIALREMVIGIYRSWNYRFAVKLVTKLYLISFPVLVTYLHPEGDALSGRNPSIEEVTNLVHTLNNGLIYEDPLFYPPLKHVIAKVFDIWVEACQEWYELKYLTYSDASIATGELCHAFVELMKTAIPIDLLWLPCFYPLISKLLEFSEFLLNHDIFTDCDNTALDLVITMAEEMLPNCHKRYEKMKQRLGCEVRDWKVLLGSQEVIEKCGDIYSKLVDLLRSLTTTYFIHLLSQPKPKELCIRAVVQLIYIWCLSKSVTLNSLRKTWTKSINCKAVLQIIKAIKEALDGKKEIGGLYFETGDRVLKLSQEVEWMEEEKNE
jgi:hypothetical protein